MKRSKFLDSAAELVRAARLEQARRAEKARASASAQGKPRSAVEARQASRADLAPGEARLGQRRAGKLAGQDARPAVPGQRPPGGYARGEGGLGTKTGPPASQPTSLSVSLDAPARAIKARELEARREKMLLLQKCRAHTSSAVDVLVDVMHNSTHAPSRVAAAKTIIEFGHGRAPEKIEIERTFSPDQIALLAQEIILRRANGAIDGGKLGGGLG